MTIPQTRNIGYYTASQWFQAAILFVALGAIAIGILSALNDAKERAEEQSVALTIRNMRTGMLYAMGDALIQQREPEIAGNNPVDWLASPPVGYRGECSLAQRNALAGGEWCFERSQGELVYKPNISDHLRDTNGQNCSQLSWRVVPVSKNIVGVGGLGLHMEAVSSCHWSLQEN